MPAIHKNRPAVAAPTLRVLQTKQAMRADVSMPRLVGGAIPLHSMVIQRAFDAQLTGTPVAYGVLGETPTYTGTIYGRDDKRREKGVEVRSITSANQIATAIAAGPVYQAWGGGTMVGVMMAGGKTYAAISGGRGNTNQFRTAVQNAGGGRIILVHHTTDEIAEIAEGFAADYFTGRHGNRNSICAAPQLIYHLVQEVRSTPPPYFLSEVWSDGQNPHAKFIHLQEIESCEACQRALPSLTKLLSGKDFGKREETAFAYTASLMRVGQMGIVAAAEGQKRYLVTYNLQKEHTNKHGGNLDAAITQEIIKAGKTADVKVQASEDASQIIVIMTDTNTNEDAIRKGMRRLGLAVETLQVY